MTKLFSPLLSLGAKGSLARVISFVKRRGLHIAEKMPQPKDARTSAQLSWRHMWQKCTALWHNLSAAEQQEWESNARSRHMTGYAWFVSQCLRPNPGIYLPLQGGTMQGDIDMAKFRLLRLPVPTDDQEAASKTYVDTLIAASLYTEGARVTHSANQAIAHATATSLAFNTERWDTDGIHDNVVNNSRLTCQTEGKYIIVAQGSWPVSAVGRRQIRILLNGTTIQVMHQWDPCQTERTRMEVATIQDIGVGDYIECIVYQNSGGVLNLDKLNAYSPEFMMQRIG